MPTVHSNRIRFSSGKEKTVSDKIWDEMKTTTERGETRRGWTKVADVQVDSATGKEVKRDATKATGGGGRKVTFKPPFLEEGGSAGAQAAAPNAPATADAPAAPAEAQGVVAANDQSDQSASPAQEEQQAPPKRQPQGNPDALAVIPQMGLKVANALFQAGFGTLEALSTADAKVIESVLDGMVPPMSPKKAQIPTWQKWAKENPVKDGVKLPGA